jgi:hypothetical protein
MVGFFNFSLQIDFPPAITAGAIADIGGCPAPPRGFPSTACRFLRSKLTARTVVVKNDPPEIIIGYRTTVQAGLRYPRAHRRRHPLQRVVNTTRPHLYAWRRVYLHVYGGWMVANALGGPWHVATSVPAS